MSTNFNYESFLIIALNQLFYHKISLLLLLYTQEIHEARQQGSTDRFSILLSKVVILHLQN